MKKIIPGISLIISTLLLITCVIRVSLLNLYEKDDTVYYELNSDNIYTMFFCAICIILWFLDNRVWKYLYLGLILLTFTDLFNFLYLEIDINIMSISLNMISCILLFIHLVFNPDIFDLRKFSS